MIYEIYTENGTKKKRALTGNGYGLPLGTWISYEGTCPDGFIESEQTFNTTTYASLYAMLGTNKVPARFDHSKLSDYEDITISSDSNNPTVMQYDGFIYGDLGVRDGGGTATVSINGTTWSYSSIGGGDSDRQIYEFRVNKGDEVYFLIPSYTWNNNTKARYYKRHLAIKATPAYVEPDTVSDMVNTLRTQDSYSTEEVNTGKKWIDGKPIYRKVVPFMRNSTLLSDFTSLGNGIYSSTVTPNNVDTMVSCRAMSERADGFVDNLCGTGGNTNGFVPKKNGNFWLFVSIGTPVSVDLIYEYTKTTD